MPPRRRAESRPPRPLRIGPDAAGRILVASGDRLCHVGPGPALPVPGAQAEAWSEGRIAAPVTERRSALRTVEALAAALTLGGAARVIAEVHAEAPAAGIETFLLHLGQTRSAHPRAVIVWSPPGERAPDALPWVVQPPLAGVRVVAPEAAAELPATALIERSFGRPAGFEVGGLADATLLEAGGEVAGHVLGGRLHRIAGTGGGPEIATLDP